MRFSIEPGTTFTTADASTVKEQHYYPYGGSRVADVVVTDRGYIGQTEDAATGLSYYDPRGVFLSPDPLTGYGGPQTLNAHSYSLGNPVTYSDPSGLCPWYRPDECVSDGLETLGAPIRNRFPNASQTIADAAGGVLEGLTLGNGDLLYEDAKVNTESGAYSAGVFGGAALHLPFAVAEGTAATAYVVTTRVAGFVNVVDDCSSEGIFSGSCGTAIATAFVPEFLGRAAGGVVSRAGAHLAGPSRSRFVMLGLEGVVSGTQRTRLGNAVLNPLGRGLARAPPVRHAVGVLGIWVVWDWFWVRAPWIVVTAAMSIANYSAWDRTGRGRWVGWIYVAMVVVMFVFFMVSPPR